MAKLSPTLCIFLLLVFAAGSRAIRDRDRDTTTTNAHVIIPNDQCMTGFGLCSAKLCDDECCEKSCFDNFKEQNPSGICEEIPGAALRFCNCYHDC
ncbi:hypothetical protein A4A49_05925 [Nicotiana attenuata]|uniref:Defensin-like protein n=1 Tax=Nicotiana attenuata TaxID=49451 RepID=A0A1J6ICK4_NICAT|nr:hypothetical protein A4A49_05925 [Nicotiana attenuata]